MSTQRTLRVGSTIVAVSLLTSCGTDELAGRRIIPSWDDFVTSSTRYFEGKAIHVVDGDVAVTLGELRDEYERWIDRAAAADLSSLQQLSTVNVANGHDDVWDIATAQDLRYCVSNEFGSRKTRVVNEIQAAAAVWQAQALVKYHYMPAFDGNCTGSNASVTFAVRPWTNGGGCAFFPSGAGCVARTLVMDYADIDSGRYGAVTSRGILRHELGHTLGLRHEHIRVTGTIASCTEDANWRALTAYDPASVMHYPWCPHAANTADLVITSRDAVGIRSLYPLPPCEVSLSCESGPTLSCAGSGDSCMTLGPIDSKICGGITCDGISQFCPALPGDLECF